MKLKSFFRQLHEKEVFKMLSIYVVSAWVILQVLSITWQPLGLPQKSVTFLILVLLLCFPVYIFLIWKFQIVPLQKKELEFDQRFKKRINAFHKVYFSSLTIITSICIIAAFLIAEKNFFQKQNGLPTVLKSDKIAVLKFGNNTGDAKYDIVGKMASDWIIHGITENQVAQVITQDLVDEYKNILKGKNISEDETTIVKEYLKPSKIISGNFYLKDGKLLFQSMLTDGKTNKTLISFKPTKCSPENPLQCIDDLNESITGYFITEDEKKLMLQETPPKYDAYKYLLEAKNSEYGKVYLNLIEKSIDADSTYFEPKVLRVGYFYNQKEYKKADSLLKLIRPDSYTNKRQLNLLNMDEALLKGDNQTVYRTLMKEYDFAPYDLITNKTAMVLALQYVNRPNDVDAIYKAINMDSLNLDNCSYCIQRIYVKALADIELGEYDTAIKNIELAQKQDEAKLLNKPLVIGYVRAGKENALDQFLRKIEITVTPEEAQTLNLQVGNEYLLKGNKEKAKEYFDKIKDSEVEVAPKMLSNAFFYSENYEEAGNILKEIALKDPKDIDALAKLAICNFKTGNIEASKKNLNTLETLRSKYQYGSVDYGLAQYYAANGNAYQLYHHLLKAAASGHLYLSNSFQNDPQFLNYSKTKEFQEAMDFWH